MFFLLTYDLQDKIHNIGIKSLHLVLLNICYFEAILFTKVYNLRVYSDALSRDKTYFDERSFLRRQWSK